ncbi:alpha/beta hydrolase family protein [Pseudarthrobacter sp. P1]|uniref:alpha/beta hydrolase family protein n=1 Tax=Pseudarthrobacter sp. P1 TaxID=3418418 RepID=UPI003CEB23F0
MLLTLIRGSGPADRHNGGLFDALRDRFASSGVAVLAYDKRGVGSSTGHWESATVDELAADAGAAVASLRGRARVDKGAVGVPRHSEGGWVALRLAARQEAPAHLILNSCPAVPLVCDRLSVGRFSHGIQPRFRSVSGQKSGKNQARQFPSKSWIPGVRR